MDLATRFNTPSESKVHFFGIDVSIWDSQLGAFRQALSVLGGRIDFVAAVAGIGERKWIPFPEECASMKAGEFAQPDLSVLDVDLTGTMYTAALAVQQFRRQEPGADGLRGRIGLVASVCGFYHVPALPVYTAAKHGVVGFTRTYGKLLPEEGIALNAVCPNIVRTKISSQEFYDHVDRVGVLVPMEGLMSAFDNILDGSDSGELYECGPRGGWEKRKETEFLDEESSKSMDLLMARARPLHYPEL